MTEPIKYALADAVEGWLRQDEHRWAKHWLQPECTLLGHAKSVLAKRANAVGQVAQNAGGAFTEKDHELLTSLLSDKSRGAAAALYPSATHEESPTLADHAYSQLAALVHGVLAADRFLVWHIDRSADKLKQFHQAALACVAASQQAWSLAVEPLRGPNDFAPDPNPIMKDSLRALYGHPDVTTSGFLALRRLLQYLLGLDGAGPEFETGATLLLYNPDRGEADCHPARIQTFQEGADGFYVDPVSMGLTVLDESMARSLSLGWTLCQESLAARKDRDEVLLAVRLSPELAGRPYRCSCLSGESAGVVLACGRWIQE